MTAPPPNSIPMDVDLAEQAKPGHGIPSQDPDAAAQTALAPEDVEREANSVHVGGGAMAGAANQEEARSASTAPGIAWWHMTDVDLGTQTSPCKATTAS